MHRFLLLMVAVVAACRSSSQPAPAPDAAAGLALKREIAAQFDRSADDWNRGDLEGFLSDYAPDSATTFVDGFRARRGFAWIRENYAPRFSPGARRDSLHFEEIEVRPLSPSLALVTARFVLERGGGVTASGPFTLVMEHRPDGWKILHDHTSSDPR
jgi:uncharacterized protein (TIGR02246 family)